MIKVAMKSALLDALGSKKALAFLVVLAVQSGASLLAWLHIGGWEVDQAAVNNVIYIGAAYILGQGIADHGKPAALVTANAGAKIAASQSMGAVQS